MNSCTSAATVVTRTHQNVAFICTELYFQPQLPTEAESVDYDSADSAVSDLEVEEEE